MNWRNNVASNRTPIQQAMTIDKRDYTGVNNVNRLMQGVVIDVFPSDNEGGNRASWQSADRHGFHHECTVLVINDGASTYMVLPNVVIPPSHPSGMDDYSERLPRPSTCLTTGEALSSGLAQVDPNELDGDMCIVGFIGGLIDQPFIISWWPHPRNFFDPATSGMGFPDANGVGRALQQHRRYFRRINGVETTITPNGDVVISTALAGSTINVQGEPENGRFARSNVAEGGSVRLYMKPDSTMEWLWDTQIDGVGPLGNPEPSLPQTNPAPSGAASTATNKISMYVLVDDNAFLIKAPSRVTVQTGTEIRLFSDDKVTVQADNGISLGVGATGPTSSASLRIATDSDATFFADDTITMQADNGFSVAAGAAGPTGTETMKVLSEQGVDILATTVLNLSAGGATTIGGSSITIGPAASVGTPPAGLGAITMDTTGVVLGEGGTEALVLGTATAAAWSSLVVSGAPAGTDAAIITNLILAVNGMINGLSLSTSNKTK